MPRTKAPKEPVKASNTFYCPTCDCTLDGVEPFKKHLTEVHKITEFKGGRRMTMHLDCADSYHSTFEWEIGGLQFQQQTTNPRSKGDYMRGPR